MGRLLKFFILVSLLCITDASARAGDLSNAVSKFLAAEIHFDPKAMETEMCREYSEVSPVGDLDDRQHVLSFYDPKNKIEVTLASSIVDQGYIGSNPFLVEKLHYSFSMGTKKRESVLIGSFYGKDDGEDVKICRVQYTVFHPHH
ncbi:hypothetical protein [Asaia bogorensis]|uniref:hypothetical protein n=1 Tax=Asaia bogorensis TaxID=91915 RepID=UPI0030199F1D